MSLKGSLTLILKDELILKCLRNFFLEPPQVNFEAPLFCVLGNSLVFDWGTGSFEVGLTMVHRVYARNQTSLRVA